MGGIAGSVKLDGTFAERQDLERAQKLLAHRGSNKKGIHLDRELGMAHNRMAAIDLSDAANQPMGEMGGRYWISFDGELYNFLELRKELQAAGYRFQSTSDTEVALAAFLAWGTDCFHQFNGVFALAVWDAQERTLVLSRDPFGFKPLYYYRDEKLFAYASEVKGFLGFEAIDLRFDPNGMAAAYSRAPAVYATEVTPWSGVKRLLGGHWICIRANDGRVEGARWWNPLANLPDVPSDLRLRTETFKELFFNACKIRMRADIPMGICVSGGITSASIWGAVQHLAREPFERISPDCKAASCISLPGVDAREQDQGEALIKEAKGNRLLFKVHPEDFARRIQDLIYLFESVERVSVERWLLYQSLSQNGRRLTLEGIGAEALLGRLPMGIAYDALDHAREILSAKSALKNPEMWKVLVAGGRLPKISKYVLQEVLDPEDFALGRHSALVKGKAELACSSYWEQDFEQLRERDLFFQAKYFYMHGGLLQSVLSVAEIASMGQGVQVRAPFLDPDLFRYCLSLPSESVIAQGKTQVILRKAMQGIVPEGILASRKQYRLARIHEMWFETLLKDIILECASSFSFRNFSVIDGKGVGKLVDQGRFSDAWPYIQAFLLNERFIEIREELFPD